MATVNYIPCKKQCPASLVGVSNYVKQEKKTFLPEQNRYLISGQNCSAQFSQLEFLATRDQFRKTSSQYFYHYTQSFHPEEPVTGELAHTIAQEFAARAWPENEVLIATHIDAAHIHSHFIVNAVCETGRMLHHGPDNLQHLRDISDEICAAHQLSVLTSPKKHTDGMSSREYRSAVKGQSWKLRMMNVIDQCMCVSGTKEDFKQAMRSYGYDLVWTDGRKYITYITPGSRKCRCSKLHSIKYTKEMMELEFRIRTEALYGRAFAQKHAGEHTADAVTAYADDDHSRAVEQFDHGNERDLRQRERTANCDPAQGASDLISDGRTEPATEAADRDPEEAGTCTTGWEETRQAYFDAVYSSAPDLAAAHAPSVAPGLGRALALLARSLEDHDDTPVEDSTTIPVQHEQKNRKPDYYYDIHY